MGSKGLKIVRYSCVPAICRRNQEKWTLVTTTETLGSCCSPRGSAVNVYDSCV